MERHSKAETFAHWTQGAQNIVIVLSLVIGGIWSIVRLDLLGELRRAKAEVALIEQQLEVQGTLVVDFTAAQIKIPSIEGYYVNIDAILSNTGSRNIAFSFTNNPLFAVIKIDYIKDGDLAYGETVNAPPAKMTLRPNDGRYDSMVLRAGSSTKLSALVQVSTTGLYWVVYSIPVSGADADTMYAALPPEKKSMPNSEATWSGGCFVIIDN